MKVICVSKKYITSSKFPKMEIGDHATVVDQLEAFGNAYYEFAEHPAIVVGTKLRRFWWRSECFDILPDPSEEVGIEQEHEAIIYQR